MTSDDLKNVSIGGLLDLLAISKPEEVALVLKALADQNALVDPPTGRTGPFDQDISLAPLPYSTDKVKTDADKKELLNKILSKLTDEGGN